MDRGERTAPVPTMPAERTIIMKTANTAEGGTCGSHPVEHERCGLRRAAPDALPRDVAWRRLDRPGFEHLRLEVAAGRVLAEGRVAVAGSEGWRRLRYRLDLSADWTVRGFEISDADDVRRTVRGGRDASGRWTVEGRAIEVSGDPRFIDVAATPFTNSLPIRGCRLDVGDAVDLCVLYLTGPDDPPRVVRQRYTRLATGSGGDRYRYESPASGFVAELCVDAHGLVVDYPALFERVAP